MNTCRSVPLITSPGKRIAKLAALLILIPLTILGTFPAQALAADGVDPMVFKMTATTLGDYSQLNSFAAQDGSIAYCMELGRDDPTSSGTTYNLGWEWLNNNYAAIVCNGYPYTTAIGGCKLTSDYARAATQFALWMEQGKVDRYGNYSFTTATGYSESGTFQNKGNSIVAAAALYDAVHAGSVKAPHNRVRRYFGPGTNQDILYVMPGSASVAVTKVDSATGAGAQAGLSLAGAEFTCVSLTDTGWSATATTDASGKLNFTDIPLGKFKIYETKAPEGYLPTSEVITLDASSKAPTYDVIELTATFSETPKSFDIEISKFKDDDSSEESGLETPVEGVQFQIINNVSGEVVGTITTNESGYADTAGDTSLWFGAGKRPADAAGAIPYCTAGYTIHEVEETVPEGFQRVGDWTIDAQSQVDGAKLQYIVDNHALNTHLQIVKIDASTQLSVPLAGFRFQLLDAEKNPVTQEVWYPSHVELNTFTTDETGSVTLPQSLVPGTYYIREVESAAPYLLNTEDLKFTIANDQELAAISVASFADELPTGAVTVLKTEKGSSTPLAGAEFDVVCKEELVAPDGTVQAVENEVVAHLTTGDDGMARAENLPLGGGTASYALVETTAPAGYLLNTEEHSFTLTYNDQVTPVIETMVAVKDDYTKLHLSKTDITGGDEIEGAQMQLIDEEGTEIDSWTSSTEPHVINHLESGVYTLIEKLTPRTYDQAEAITFELEPSGEVQTVEMKDSPIEINAQIDKRQEIASSDGTEAGIKDEYSYSIDFRNLSNTWTDEFTVEDTLDGVVAGLVELKELTTPRAKDDYDGLMNVWYKTNKSAATGTEETEDSADNTTEEPDEDESESNDENDGSGEAQITGNATLSDKHENLWLSTEEVIEILGEDARMLDYSGWTLWKEGVSCAKSETLKVSDLKLEKDEQIIAVRFEFGRVEKGFSSRPAGTELWDRKDLKSETDNFSYNAKDYSEEYASAILCMRPTSKYKAGVKLENSAEVHAYRNGGGDKLEGHDDDRVVQQVTTKPATPNTPNTPPTKTKTPLPKTGTQLPIALLTAFFSTASVALVGALAIRSQLLPSKQLLPSFRRLKSQRPLRAHPLRRRNHRPRFRPGSSLPRMHRRKFPRSRPARSE